MRSDTLIRAIAGSIFLLLVCAFVLVASSAEAGLRDYPYRLETVKNGRFYELIAHNEGPATITLHLTVGGENVGSDVKWPVTRALKAHTATAIAKLFAEDRSKAARFNYTESIQFGDFRAIHASETAYRLPYAEGAAFRITQAYGDSLTTHVGHQSEHAVDFATPEGTPIVAARGGTVIDVTLRYESGGLSTDLRDKANGIAILHEDGTVGQYGHLAKRDPLVKAGQRVTAGTVIGYSGNTGYSSGPHLHFAVTRPEIMADGRVGHVSLPVKFYVDTATLPFEPRRGLLVTASYAQDSAPRIASASRPEPHQGSAVPTIEHALQVASLYETGPATVDRTAATQPLRSAPMLELPARDASDDDWADTLVQALLAALGLGVVLFVLVRQALSGGIS
ncbi:MAG TPA: M23 family metallopeptidase [Burkholderiales bacterium]|nr:M23 family metallopeptidase [Burkholderiales bacterium]